MAERWWVRDADKLWKSVDLIFVDVDFDWMWDERKADFRWRGIHT